ncbi:MAG TPA: glutamyl-tRNA reductase, partial [Sulfurovum sp.]|nr:glutamyl-tRNA reductase [Sulfurovum sp.]
TATSSTEPIITHSMVESKDADRLWFDMAIPRDIADIDEDNVKVYRIDDLQNISKSNHALRQEQALKATEVVARHTDDFYMWLQALTIEPVIKGMRLAIDEVIEAEVARSIKKGYLPEQYSENAKRMIVQVFDKYLHQPSKNLREIAKQNDGQSVVDTFKAVFDINTDDSDPKQYKKPSAEMMKKLKGENR